MAPRMEWVPFDDDDRMEGSGATASAETARFANCVLRILAHPRNRMERSPGGDFATDEYPSASTNEQSADDRIIAFEQGEAELHVAAESPS